MRNRIYADFNGLLPGLPEGSNAVRLEGFGTLRDLHENKILLIPGLKLQVWSDSGTDEAMEVDAIARWRVDPSKQRGGEWVADFNPNHIQYLKTTRKPISPTNWFPCLACGNNLVDELDRSQIPPLGSCKKCGTPIGLPFNAPRQ